MYEINPLIIFGIIVLLVVIAASILTNGNNSLDIKAHKVGDGQYGTADWANKNEIHNNLSSVLFEPEKWRNGQERPSMSGTILATEYRKNRLYSLVDTSDSHTMVIAAPSGGKTTSILYPNIEYSAACGNSFLVTDTKGDIHTNYVPILQNCYGMKIYVIDLRNPANSDGYNLLTLVNKYLDRYKATGDLANKAKAEAYSKMIAKTIIELNDTGRNAGQNQFFYTSAEGLISGIIYLVSELFPDEERHIVSVFKIIRQLLEIDPATVKKDKIPQTYFQELYAMLPESHISKDLLSATATSEFKTIASITSTAISQMLSFIDAEMEQLLCNGTIDIENFVQGKTAIIFIFDESSNARNVIGNMLIRQTYNECLKASEKYPDNRLPVRINYYLDEFGTYSKIDGVEQFFSAGRSRNIICNPIIQSLSQLDNKYGKDIAKTIKATCQNVMFGFQSPLSEDSEIFSKMLSTQTVQAGSISNNKGKTGGKSKSYTMVKKPLMSADEIKHLKKGDWIVLKTGMNPFKAKLPTTEKWGIKFGEKFIMHSKLSTQIQYGNRQKLLYEIQMRFGKTIQASPQINNKKSDISDDYT